MRTDQSPTFPESQGEKDVYTLYIHMKKIRMYQIKVNASDLASRNPGPICKRANKRNWSWQKRSDSTRRHVYNRHCDTCVKQQYPQSVLNLRFCDSIPETRRSQALQIPAYDQQNWSWTTHAIWYHKSIYAIVLRIDLHRFRGIDIDMDTNIGIDSDADMNTDIGIDVRDVDLDIGMTSVKTLPNACYLHRYTHSTWFKSILRIMLLYCIYIHVSVCVWVLFN